MPMRDSLLVVISHFITLLSAEANLLQQWFVPKGGYFLRSGEVSRKSGFVLQGVLHYFQTSDGQELTTVLSWIWGRTAS
jgi:hypothetical protein